VLALRRPIVTSRYAVRRAGHGILTQLPRFRDTCSAAPRHVADDGRAMLDPCPRPQSHRTVNVASGRGPPPA
jgi:hypothetical protein